MIGGSEKLASQDELKKEIIALRERISRLAETSLRINSSLELRVVLQEAVDSARFLTGARYGAIVTSDQKSRPIDFFSSGMTEDLHRSFREWPNRVALFELLRDMKGNMRLPNLAAHVESFGFSSHLIPGMGYLGATLRHRDEVVGNFFLCEKEGGAVFSDEDEEILLQFTSLAATAIANARAFRKEQRAKADFEALIETSPVGVIVLSGQSRSPKRLNQEAIKLIDRLAPPDQNSPEELLDTLTFRRIDGSEIDLANLPKRLIEGKIPKIRAEELEVLTPDGRYVNVLVNCTPVLSAEGERKSIVITMQDLAPLKALERQRAEFLSMVSHELRIPLSAIKGSATVLLNQETPPDAVEVGEYHRLINDQADHMRTLIADLLDTGRIEAGILTISPSMETVPGMLEKARTVFGQGGGGRAVVIDLPPDLPPVMAERQRIVQVLNNLLSNSARHSPESSSIQLSAEIDGPFVAISVADEGIGVPPEKLRRLFQKHVGSSRKGVGGGLGLAICKGLVEAHGGRIRAENRSSGKGLRIVFTLPIAEMQPDAPSPPLAAQTGSSKTGHNMKILVVDDDPHTLRYCRDALNPQGYQVVVTAEYENLGFVIRKEKPNLVLLDLVLPRTDGIELMETVPELTDQPVVFISGYGRDDTVAKALDAGAADYIVKPFSPTELAARIRAALRKLAKQETFTFGGLVIDYEMRQISVAGEAVELTTTEYEILRLLSMNSGRLVSFDRLLREVWHDRTDDTRVVRTFIKNLRQKLRHDDDNTVYIQNVRGAGYRIPRPSPATTTNQSEPLQSGQA